MGQKSITILLIDIGPTNSAELNWKKLSTQVIHKKLIYRLKTDLIGIVSLGKIKEKKETLSDTVRVIKKAISARSEDIKLIENLTSTNYEANVLEGLIECCNLLTEDFKLKDYSKQIILISKLPYISKNSENSDFIQQKLIRAINLLNINLTWWGGDPSNITNNTEFNRFFLKLKNRDFVEFEKSKDLYHIWDTQLDEARVPTNLFFVDFILGSDENNLKFPLVGFKHFVVADEKVNIIEAKKAETKRKNAEEENEEEYNYYLGATKVPSDFVLERMDLSESSARVHGFIPLSNIQVLHFHSSPVHFYLKNTATKHECQLWVDLIEALLEIERAALVRLNVSKKNNQNNPKILSMALMIPKKRTDNNLPYFICRQLPFQREDVNPHLIDPIPYEQELNEEQLIEDFMNQLTISDNSNGDGNGEGIDLNRLVRPPMKIDSELNLDDLIEYLPSQIRENLQTWDSNDADLKKVFDKYTQES